MDDIIAMDKEIEQLLQQITVAPEQAADGIAVVDSAGVIRFVNSSWAMMHGYETTEQLIGKHISVFHTKEQMTKDIHSFIEEVKRRGQLAGPIEYMRSDGTVFRSQTKMITARNNEGKAIGLVVFAKNSTSNGQIPYRLRNHTNDSTAASERLQYKIVEYEKTVNELKEQRDKLEQHLGQQGIELNTAKEQIQDKIAERQQIQQQLKQQGDELITALAKNDQLQSQISEHQAQEQILKTRVADLTATNEKSQDQIAKHKHKENVLAQDREHLEQRIALQAKELSDLRTKLQQEVTKCSKLDQSLKQQADELKTANKEIQETSAEQAKTCNRISEQKLQLKSIKQQLKWETARRRQAEEDLANLQAKIDNIHTIARKYL